MSKPYPNEALTEVCKLLLEEYELTAEQIRNLALDISQECEAIEEARNEAAWERWNEREHDDSDYRQAMMAAGRGHLLK